jgi:hypothetical protein
VASVTSFLAHRVRALTSSVLEGLAVGGLVASREAPPRSRPRVLAATAAGVVLAADQASLELPAMLREHRVTGAVGPTPAHERRALLQGSARALGFGLLLQLLDRPVRASLARRGVRHPHRWFGAVAAAGQIAVLVPVYWRLGTDRARAAAEREAAIEAELQEMAAGR